MSAPRHGTLNGYVNGRCRCDECRQAGSVYNAARRVQARTTEPPAWAHGSLSTYVNLCCRCEQCRAARAAYQREVRARQRQAVSS